MTGIDFFPQLNDTVESELELKSDYKAWAFWYFNYHSFTLLASIFKKINNKMVKPQSPEPP
jgi:hypothetical protein